jgi:hypothetical protein
MLNSWTRKKTKTETTTTTKEKGKVKVLAKIIRFRKKKSFLIGFHRD